MHRKILEHVRMLKIWQGITMDAFSTSAHFPFLYTERIDMAVLRCSSQVRCVAVVSGIYWQNYFDRLLFTL